LSTKVRTALDRAVDELAYSTGWHEVSLDEICRRAGLSKPAIYRHVGSRDDLMLDYLRRRRTRRMAELDHAIDRAGPAPIARLAAIIDFYVTWISSPEFAGCGFHRAMQQRSPRHTEVRALTHAYKSDLHTRIKHELAGLRPDADASADHILLLIEGALAAGAYEVPAITTSRLCNAIATLLKTGAKPTKGN
jgi:AcrR family transcriptional regulator